MRVTYHGYLVKACPEHLRAASDDEKFILTDFISDCVDTKNALDEKKTRRVCHLDPVEGPETPVPRFRLVGEPQKICQVGKKA